MKKVKKTEDKGDIAIFQLKCFDRYALSVWVSAGIAILGVFSGGLASFFTAEIKGSFPFLYLGNWNRFFDPSSYGPISYESATFWVVVFIFFVLVFWRDRAVARKNEYEQRRLESAYTEVGEQIERYTQLLRTLPPKDFLYVYRETFLKSRKAAELAIDLGQIDDEELRPQQLKVLEEAVRTVLTALVDLAYQWDSPIPKNIGEVTYRANIMIYHDLDEYSDDELKKLWVRKRFFVAPNIATAAQSIDGVLDLPDNRFTTTTSTSEPLPDDDITPFALPVTRVRESNDGVTEDGRYIQNIPGAPSAFVNCKSEWIFDKEGMIEKCAKIKGLTGHVQSEIEHYYREKTSTSSIVSFPLTKIDDEGLEEPIAVLNIYRNKDSILRNEERSSEYDSLIQPFCLLLVELLTYHGDLMYTDRTDS